MVKENGRLCGKIKGFFVTAAFKLIKVQKRKRRVISG